MELDLHVTRALRVPDMEGEGGPLELSLADEHGARLLILDEDAIDALLDVEVWRGEELLLNGGEGVRCGGVLHTTQGVVGAKDEGSKQEDALHEVEARRGEGQESKI